MEVFIAPKGKVLLKKWIPSTRKYKFIDVTKKSFRYLNESCTIQKGVVLRDIFLILKKNLEIYDLFFGNWCKEIVEEGLKKTKKKESGIDFLELYWMLYSEEIYTKEKLLTGNIIPQFHGIGRARKNEDFYKKGDIINWGVSLSKANELAHLPLKFNKKIQIADLEQRDPMDVEAYDLQYSLMHVMYAIIWELSFHGGPEKREAFSSQLRESVKSIKKSYTSEEVLSKITKKKSKLKKKNSKKKK